VYFASELVEVAQGDFSTARLALAYFGEAGIVFAVIGLYAVQRPRVGRLGLYGALAYAYAFAFFASTVVYALAAGSKNWAAVTDVFGGWLTLHGAIMVAGGVAFGLAVIKTAALPCWTAVCLMAGVVLVAAAAGMPTAVRAGAAALPQEPSSAWASWCCGDAGEAGSCVQSARDSQRPATDTQDAAVTCRQLQTPDRHPRSSKG
jgi:hypothetical protein